MRVLNAVYLLTISIGLLGTGFVFIFYDRGISFRQEIFIDFVGSPLKEVVGLFSILLGLLFAWKGVVCIRGEDMKEKGKQS